MSKKILKRSLALGALMAMVITGNVLAGERYLEYYDSEPKQYGDVNSPTVVENYTLNDQGAAVKIGNGCSVTFCNYEFKNNEAQKSDGGAVFVGNSTVRFDYCDFIGNKVTDNTLNQRRSGAAAYTNGGHLIFNGCYFEGNIAEAQDPAYGSVVGATNRATLTVKDSTFFKNIGGNSNGLIYSRTGGSVYLDGNTFKENDAIVVNIESDCTAIFTGKNDFINNANIGIQNKGKVIFATKVDPVTSKNIYSEVTFGSIEDNECSFTDDEICPVVIQNYGSITIEEGNSVKCTGLGGDFRDYGTLEIYGDLTVGGSSQFHSMFEKPNIYGNGKLNVHGIADFKVTNVLGELNVNENGVANFKDITTVNGTLNINKNGNGNFIGDTVVNGKLNVHGVGDFKVIGINGELNINQNGNSNFTGTTTINGELNVKENGKANFTGDTVINGKLNLSGDSNLNTISGDGEFNFLKAVDVSVEENNSKALKFTATGDVNDAIGGDVNKLIKKIDWNTDAVMVMEEGDIQGKVTAYMKENTDEEEFLGNLKVYYQKEEVNTKNQAITDNGIALKLHWRSHLSDMNKRMGELRDAHGELGVWTRMVRGENEYKGTKAQYNQYQLGYDEKLSVDKRWTVGAAITFAEGDASYGYGTTDDKSTAFTIYGSKLNNDGSYVDLIARYEHLESKLDDVNSGKGDYGTNGFSVGAEFGKRFDQNDGAWIEPQVQLTYGTVDSAEFVIGGKNVQVGDMDSLIGRIGFRIGQDIEQGNVYARASYLYDFDGKTEATFSNINTSRTIKEDLGGGWWEVGIGTNINLSKATYLYAEVDKTFGGEVDTNWQWNLGVRYSF